MTSKARIHQSIAAHLQSLDEVRALLAEGDSASTERHLAALDALCGALEDMRLELGQLTDLRHRFVLSVLLTEAEALLGGPSGLPRAWLDRDARVGLAVRHEVVAARAATRPAAVARRLATFAEQRLAPFVAGWGRPVAQAAMAG